MRQEQTEDKEVLRHLGYDPSWFGLQILFCLSGYLAVRSLTRHGSSLRYLTSRVLRTGPFLSKGRFGHFGGAHWLI